MMHPLEWWERRTLHRRRRLALRSEATARCDVDPRQYVAVSGVRTSLGSDFVAICWGREDSAHDVDGLVLLSAAAGRIFAAAILNASDELDGTTPLQFAGPGSDAR
jgi:hypothetical protein